MFNIRSHYFFEKILLSKSARDRFPVSLIQYLLLHLKYYYTCLMKEIIIIHVTIWIYVLIKRD